MSTADFQERLQRINAHAPQQQPMSQDKPGSARTRMKKPNFSQLAVGGAIMLVGNRAVKHVNENYELIRDSSGVGMAVGLAFAAIAVFLVGIFLIIRAFLKGRAEPARSTVLHHSDNVVRPQRESSSRAKSICSLLGFCFGAIATFYMFMSAAARLIETENAELFSNGGLLIAALLVIVSSLIGMVGLFLRGYAMGRVPVYFVIGAGLTFAAVRLFGINMLEWQQFTVQLQ